MLLAPLKRLFKPAVKSPQQKLQETRVMLRGWIAEVQTEIADCTDELYAMGERDRLNAYKAQIEQIDHTLIHPEWWTAAGLESLLREKFRIYDGLDASLANLPTFDEDEDDLDYTTMPAQERIQRKASSQYHDQQFKLRHQIDLLARFAGVSERRVHDVIHIMYAHYVPVEDRPAMKNEEAAACYPVVRAWLEGSGSIKDLDIPAEFSAWMPEHEPLFPVLI